VFDHVRDDENLRQCPLLVDTPAHAWARIEVTKVPTESYEISSAEALVTEEEHAVLKPGAVDRRPGRRAGILGEIHTANLGADGLGQWHHLNPTVSVEASDISSIWCSLHSSVPFISLPILALN
jgi:hypothetical protein